MSELNLRFSGLCAFVPKHPLSASLNQMRTLLVDARGHGAHAHVPVLVVQDGLVDINPPFRSPDGSFTIASTKYYYFALDDQDVMVPGAQPEHLTVTTGGGSGCPQSDYDSFEWIVPMGGVTPGSGDVLPACLTPAGHHSVVARVLLWEGVIEKSRFAVEPPNYVLLWEFKPAGGGAPSGHQQAMAEEIRYRYDYSTEHGDLVTTNFKSGGSPQTIRLLPVFTMMGPKLFTAVYNLPWDNIRHTLVYTPPRQPDYHFTRQLQNRGR